MSKQVRKEDLRKLIAMGKEADALKWMLANSRGQKKDVRKLINLQSNRFQKLKRKRLEGSIDPQSVQVIAAQISGDLLEIIEVFSFEPGEAPTSSSDVRDKAGKEEEKIRSYSYASIGLILGAIILILLSVQLFRFFNPDKQQEEKQETLSQSSEEESILSQGSIQQNLAFSMEDWLGDWELVMESDEGRWTGNLKLENDSGIRAEKCKMFVTDNFSHNLILNISQIEPASGQLKGTWEIEIDFSPDPENFTISLEADKNSFIGSYKYSIHTTRGRLRKSGNMSGTRSNK